ncbi:MAG: RTX toxin, partial [Pseudomonadota bacterium]
SRSEDSNLRNETDFSFNQVVPDGSHLVVTATDDAGNSSGTYVVLDDEVASTNVTLSNPTLGNYNIEAVDLSFAEEGQLTVDEAALLALSSNTNELLIKGGSDDSLTINGATARTGSTVRDGESYDVYTIGSEGTIIVDDDINIT